MIDEHLHALFFNDNVVLGRMPEIRQAVLDGIISPTQAVTELITMFDINKAITRQSNVLHPSLSKVQEVLVNNQ